MTLIKEVSCYITLFMTAHVFLRAIPCTPTPTEDAF